MSHAITTPSAPTPTAPIAQGIRWGSMVFTSGQLPKDPATGTITATDLRGQAEQALKNVQAVLEAGGSSLSRVLRVNCYLTDITGMAVFNEVYETFFTDWRPARTTVEVTALAAGALIEIDAVGVTDEAPDRDVP